jgi:HEAT repeat protein
MKNILAEIADSARPLKSGHLADLSQITVADLPLLKQVWSGIDTERRRKILSRLVELTHDNVEFVFDVVLKYALRDVDAEVRSLAIEGLWENEDPALIHTYIRMLEQDTSEKVQVSAALALGRFALLVELGEIRSQYKETICKSLLTALEDTAKPPEVRRRALEAIAQMSTASVKEAIRKAYESRDERYMVGALYAMGRTCDETWLPVLYTEMGNADAEMRYEAAGACGEIGDEEAVSHLAEIIYDSDIEVRLAVIQALGKIGGNEAKRELQSVANDPNEAVRDAVTQALSELAAQQDLTLFTMENTRGQHDEQSED